MRETQRYIPSGYRKITDKKSDAVCYVKETVNSSGNTQYHAIGFAGKAIKASFRYYYHTAAQREASVKRFFEGRQSRLESTAKRREEQKKPHHFEVGHVLVSSWGYEQTNVDYFQVTKILGPRMVEIREISHRLCSDNDGYSSMAGRVFPCIDEFKGEARRVRVTNGYVKISSCSSARLWDGHPNYCSWYA